MNGVCSPLMATQRLAEQVRKRLHPPSQPYRHFACVQPLPHLSLTAHTASVYRHGMHAKVAQPCLHRTPTPCVTSSAYAPSSDPCVRYCECCCRAHQACLNHLVVWNATTRMSFAPAVGDTRTHTRTANTELVHLSALHPHMHYLCKLPSLLLTHSHTPSTPLLTQTAPPHPLHAVRAVYFNQAGGGGRPDRLQFSLGADGQA